MFSPGSTACKLTPAVPDPQGAALTVNFGEHVHWARLEVFSLLPRLPPRCSPFLRHWGDTGDCALALSPAEEVCVSKSTLILTRGRHGPCCEACAVSAIEAQKECSWRAAWRRPVTGDKGSPGQWTDLGEAGVQQSWRRVGRDAVENLLRPQERWTYTC